MRTATDVVIRALAVGLLLIGAMMLIAGLSSVVPFALIALGAALTAIIQTEKRRRYVAH